MSLLIEGMDMPKHAVRNGTDDTMYRGCVLVHPDGTAELVVDFVFADQFNFDHNLKRFSLTEIPTPHGRLIDADRLLAPGRIAKFPAGQEILFADAIRYAPTIIEAEGKT
jgi:hypothetical protein